MKCVSACSTAFSLCQNPPSFEEHRMLDAVTKGFRAAKHKLTGKAELTEANIDDALRDIRVALLEADVQFNVAKRFLARVKEKALGEVETTNVTDNKGKKQPVQPSD